MQLLRADTDGRGERQLAAVPDATWTTFSPDGRWVFFSSSKDGASLFFTSVERMNVWKWTFAGGEPRKVTNFSDRSILRLAPSADGKSVLVSRGTAVRDAFLLTNFQ